MEIEALHAGQQLDRHDVRRVVCHREGPPRAVFRRAPRRYFDIAALAGVLNGVLIARFRLMPFIVTLCTYIGARGAALIVSDRETEGQGRPIQGTYQSPILVQWAKASAKQREVEVVLTRFR